MADSFEVPQVLSASQEGHAQGRAGWLSEISSCTTGVLCGKQQRLSGQFIVSIRSWQRIWGQHHWKPGTKQSQPLGGGGGAVCHQLLAGWPPWSWGSAAHSTSPGSPSSPTVLHQMFINRCLSVNTPLPDGNQPNIPKQVFFLHSESVL